MLVDEVVMLAKNICTACPSALCLTLLPMMYSGHEQSTIMTHKRQLEDLMMACFGLTQGNTSDNVSLGFFWMLFVEFMWCTVML